jgi:hypothetical protein
MSLSRNPKAAPHGIAVGDAWLHHASVPSPLPIPCVATAAPAASFDAAGAAASARRGAHVVARLGVLAVVDLRAAIEAVPAALAGAAIKRRRS